MTSVEKAGGRNTLKLTTLQQVESVNVQVGPTRAAHDPEPEEAGAAAGDPPVAGMLDPLNAGLLDPLKAGFLDPLNAGLLDPLKAGFLDPLVAGILVCAEAQARAERMNVVKIIVVWKVVVITNRKIELIVMSRRSRLKVTGTPGLRIYYRLGSQTRLGRRFYFVNKNE